MYRRIPIPAWGWSGFLWGWSVLLFGWSGLLLGWPGLLLGWSGLLFGWSGLSVGWSDNKSAHNGGHGHDDVDDDVHAIDGPGKHTGGDDTNQITDVWK